MKTSEFFKQKTVLSLEVFPPKRTAPVDTVYKTLDGLKGITPDFISVTYGAGGIGNSRATLEIASSIKHRYGIESVAHMPCLHLTKEEAARILEQLKAHQIENILALRGDRIPDMDPAGGLSMLRIWLDSSGTTVILTSLAPVTRKAIRNQGTWCRTSGTLSKRWMQGSAS